MAIIDYNAGELALDAQNIQNYLTLVGTYTDIQRALDQMRFKAPFYSLYAAYYDGQHRLAFATDKWRSAFAPLFRTLTDNVCQIVVDAPAERLQVTGFGVEVGAPSLGEAAAAIWQENRMDVRAGFVHREALRAGDAYILVWPNDAGDPTFWPQLASLCTVAYDEEYDNKIAWAAKVWVDVSLKRLRLNLYYTDRIEKYWTTSSYPYQTTLPDLAQRFEPFIVEGEPWPLPNPWGTVPLFHFANNAWLTAFGRSELHAIIPLQDALNKTLADQMVAQEFQAFPQRWAVGLEVEIDETTGKAKAPFDPGADRLWAAANENIKFGQFDAANLKQYLEIEEALRLEMTRLAALPPHFMQQWSGHSPSGEALRTAESRFIKKIQDRQAVFGNTWEDAMTLALRMAGQASEATRLSTIWVDAAPTTEQELLNNLLIKEQLGISQRQALSEAGYSDQEIAEMQTEKAAQVDAQRQLFNSGVTPATMTFK